MIDESGTDDSPLSPSVDSGPGLFGDAPAAAPKAYKVLARKYRPASFEDLIGQDAMVRTLSNAFDLNRIHQAYMLTGVRGVGKTTTARILARAFNYEVPAHDGKPAINQPTIHMPELGLHCQAIIDSRHVDVIEMDAASHTGIDDVREIIESARYRPVLARTKVYIIDEVHMLSKQAFNGLLKTLEEPPEHVRFLFATTEIDKVPVTVRSRCQRFDLRRVEADVLTRHLATLCAKEKVEVDHEALTLIARASEGSVRDSLSLLDQAIAHGSGAPIQAPMLRAMLGLADRGRIIDLFDDLMKGDMASALEGLKSQHDCGADPGQVLVELAEFVHFVTKLEIAPTAVDPLATEDERKRGADFAERLSMSVLSRAWQILLKGLQEVKDSPRPLAAADMVLVRLGYAADLPSPEDVLRRLSSSSASPTPASGGSSGSGGGGPRASMTAVASAPRLAATQAAPVRAAITAPELEPGLRLNNFADLVALAGEKRDIQLKTALERDVQLVRFEQGSIEFSLAPGGSAQLAQTLMRKLQEWTGQRWMVALSTAAGAPSLTEQASKREDEKRLGVQAHPLVRATLEQFPGAAIVAVRTAAPEPVAFAAPLAEAEDVAYVDDDDSADDFLD